MLPFEARFPRLFALDLRAYGDLLRRAPYYLYMRSPSISRVPSLLLTLVEVCHFSSSLGDSEDGPTILHRSILHGIREEQPACWLQCIIMASLPVGGSCMHNPNLTLSMIYETVKGPNLLTSPQFFFQIFLLP